MHTYRVSWIVFMLAAILVAGCGGGGGGGSTSQYIGITSPAVLADNNAETIALEAYQAGDLSASTAGLLSRGGGGISAVGAPAAIAIPRLLGDAVGQISLRPGAAAGRSSAKAATPMTVVTESDTVFDGMGGSMSYALSVDDQTGNFSGTFQFNSWHGDGGEVFNGRAVVSGNFDLVASEFTQITFSFDPVTFSNGSGSFSIYGSVSLSIGATSGSALLDLVLRDESTKETVWIDNYSVTTAYGPDSDFDGRPDFEDAEISGRIYLSNHGYVDVTTPMAFRYYAGYDLPSTGQMVVAGFGGNRARLTVIDGIPVSSGYYVEADLDGLPGYEWRSLDRPWI